MASSTTAAAITSDNRDKTVTGYPLPASTYSNVVTGYPRVIPPPPSPPAVYLNQLFRRNNQRHRLYLIRYDQIFLYRLLLAALSLFVFTGCLCFLLWLILRPHVPQVHLASFTVSHLSTTNTKVSAACNVSVLLTNPNRKLTVFYDSFQLHLHYQTDHVPLSHVQVPPFAQPKKNDTLLHTHLEITNASVGNEVVKALNEDLGRGLVSFEVKIFALLRLQNKQWRTKSQLIKVYCGDVVLGFSVSNEPGFLLNPHKECQVSLRR